MAAGRMAALAFTTSLPSTLGAEEEELIELLDQIGRVIARFMPRSVTLQDWAEQRVPASDAARVNASGLVYVQSKGTKVVTESRVPLPPRGPPPPNIAANLRSSQPAANAAFAPKRRRPQFPAANPVPPKCHRLNEEVFDMQTFLQELPEDEFSPQEAALRLEIIKHIFRALGQVPCGAHVVALIAEVSCVKGALESFSLPANHLHDWMRERVGNEFLVSGNEHGDTVVELEKTMITSGAAQREISADFFSSLPPESFSPEEAHLRDAMCDFIDHFQGNGIPTLTTMCRDQKVGRAKCALLPHGVSLKTWIETRCGETFDVDLLPKVRLQT